MILEHKISLKVRFFLFPGGYCGFSFLYDVMNTLTTLNCQTKDM